jgi:hypothetical protein
VTRLPRNWSWRKAGKPAGEEDKDPSSLVSQIVHSEGAAHIAGRDQSINHIDQVNVNISLTLGRLLLKYPKATPYVYEVASEAGISIGNEVSAEDVLHYLADLNIPAEAFPVILKVSELASRHATGQEMRDEFGSVAEQWAAQVPARREALEDLRSESDKTEEDYSSDKACLLIALDPDYYSADRYRLSIVLYRDGRDGDRKDGSDDAMPIAEIEARLKMSLPVLFRENRNKFLVEFAVPPELLCTAFDQWFIPNRPDGLPEEDIQLGERFPVVVRDIERMAPGTDRSMWEYRWQRLCACTSDGLSLSALRWVFPEKNETYRQLRASLWLADSHGKACLALLPGPSEMRRMELLLMAGFEAGIPAAVWLREPGQGGYTMADDRQYLKAIVESADLHSLPARVLDLRLRAVADGEPEGHPGTRVSLLWADPGRTWEQPFKTPEPSSNGADF